MHGSVLWPLARYLTCKQGTGLQPAVTVIAAILSALARQSACRSRAGAHHFIMVCRGICKKQEAGEAGRGSWR